MSREKNIASHLHSWNIVQQQKSKRSSQGLKKKKRQRPQSGIFHVFVRGTNHKVIFYDNQDRSFFLLILNEEARKLASKISAFILMDNHIHLQLSTDNLTPLMKGVLSRYAVWFNNRRGWKGPLFEKPFGSSQIFSRLLIKENILYILSNSIREGICKNPEDYVWSSYHFYFTDSVTSTTKLLDVNALSVESLFVSGKNLRSEIITYSPDSESSKTKFSGRTPYADVINYFNKLLEGRNVYTLSTDELNSIIRRLKFEKFATYWQIASIVRIGYNDVRKIFEYT